MITRSEIEATVWLNNSPLPNEICRANPELTRYGFYRRLNDGRFEFVSFCRPNAKEWIAIHKDDLERLLNKLRESENKK